MWDPRYYSLNDKSFNVCCQCKIAHSAWPPAQVVVQRATSPQLSFWVSPLCTKMRQGLRLRLTGRRPELVPLAVRMRRSGNLHHPAMVMRRRKPYSPLSASICDSDNLLQLSVCATDLCATDLGSTPETAKTEFYLSFPAANKTDFSSASRAEPNRASPCGRSGRFCPCGPRQKS